MTGLLFLLGQAAISSSNGDNLAVYVGLVAALLAAYTPPVFLMFSLGRPKIPAWGGVFVVSGSALTAAMSGTWASMVLNAAFGVAASNFPITYAALTFAFLPLLWLISMSASALIFMVTIMLRAMGKSRDENWRPVSERLTALVIGLAIYIAMTIWTAFQVVQGGVGLAGGLATVMDFDSYHRCRNLRLGLEEKLKHIGDGLILVAAKGDGQSGIVVRLQSCEYESGTSVLR
ncbi:membrane hypothetical protein [Xanthomonas citri pv. citri]|uniref:Uncharacterized protein n=1 Tax=Xanthomonas citri pv. citri TaxID=611301 RepID=A0A0U5F912_XANCI|nr:membrane hypothetical protein [Xanthomonas citri pv. citri]